MDAKGGLALVDDSALTYYLYGQVESDKVITPFFYNYNSLSGLPAYTLALRDQKFNLVILDGGATATGKDFWEKLRPVIKSIPTYQLVYSQPLNTPFMDEGHTLEIYRLLSKEDLAQGRTYPVIAAPAPLPTAPAPTGNASSPVVTPIAVPAGNQAPPVSEPNPAGTVDAQTAAAPTPTSLPALTLTPAPTVEPVYPAKASYDFAAGDEGWGALPAAGGLQPGMAVSSDSTYKLANHNSLKFSPKPETRLYTVGVNKTGDFHKISLFVYIPADKADTNVRLGLYYFDKAWTWVDNGFQDTVIPGQWTQLNWELDKPVSMEQFGLKLAGFSGSIYINGVVIE
jgi:hypothetical protein